MGPRVHASEDRDGWPPRGRPFIGYPRTYGKLVQGTNINASTLLATDYLNHFNEIVMLLELTPSMPDCLDEARAWRPLSYEEHFRTGVLSDRSLIIAAYDHCPPDVRDPFDETIGMITERLAEGLQEIGDLLSADRQPLMAHTVETVTGEVRQLIDLASALIHGGDQALTQGAIDAVISRRDGQAAADPQADDAVLDQDAIDALFG